MRNLLFVLIATCLMACGAANKKKLWIAKMARAVPIEAVPDAPVTSESGPIENSTPADTAVAPDLAEMPASAGVNSSADKPTA